MIYPNFLGKMYLDFVVRGKKFQNCVRRHKHMELLKEDE